MSSQKHNRVSNFAAGPSQLPLSVLEECHSDLFNWHNSGQSVLEMSHRSKEFTSIFNNAQKDLRYLLNIPSNYHIFFMQGGATMQFSAITFNFQTNNCSNESQPPQYIITGSWSKKAFTEACKLGHAQLLFSNMDGNASKRGCSIPNFNELDINPKAKYLYLCVNETIHGCKININDETIDYSKIKCPIIADMSSCFLSETVDVSKFAVIFAGAQKNAGPAGLTVVIVRDDVIGNAAENTPVLFDFATWKKKAIYNTPCCYAIYCHGLVMRWLRNTIGGLSAMNEINISKAQLIYDVIDEEEDGHQFYFCPVNKNCRSLMNVRFNIIVNGKSAKELELKFIADGEKCGLINLKGHSSLGGCRASLYNAQPFPNCQKLALFMRNFREEYRRNSGENKISTSKL